MAETATAEVNFILVCCFGFERNELIRSEILTRNEQEVCRCFGVIVIKRKERSPKAWEESPFYPLIPHISMGYAPKPSLEALV
jgi:hypothetical protein